MREKLIAARGSRTQEEIASICGVSQQTVSHWENGRATPSVRVMVLLEKYLGVPKEELFLDLFYSLDEGGNEQAATKESA